MDLDRWRRRLQAERDRLLRRLRRDSEDRAAYLQRVATRDPCAILSATAADEESVERVRGDAAHAAAAELEAVTRALQRLENDPVRFGRCADCGVGIAAERLDLIPHALRCSRCAEDG